MSNISLSISGSGGNCVRGSKATLNGQQYYPVTCGGCRYIILLLFLFQITLKLCFSIREYKVSKTEQGKWSKAMTICENLSLGLAMWHTHEGFDDMKTITGSSNGFFDKPAWTALNNANKKSCASAQTCNGKLVA